MKFSVEEEAVIQVAKESVKQVTSFCMHKCSLCSTGKALKQKIEHLVRICY